MVPGSTVSYVRVRHSLERSCVIKSMMYHSLINTNVSAPENKLEKFKSFPRESEMKDYTSDMSSIYVYHRKKT